MEQVTNYLVEKRRDVGFRMYYMSQIYPIIYLVYQKLLSMERLLTSAIPVVKL